MTKFSKFSAKPEVDLHKDTRVTNFMGGNSYSLNPLDTLRIVAASSIFGEPSYYRKSSTGSAFKNVDPRYSLFDFQKDSVATTESVFEGAIDAALNVDFKGTLELAVKLRNEMFMRLNPAVIFVKAMMHKDRASFTKENPGFMKEIAKAIVLRPDDITNQFEIWMWKQGKKNGMPTLMKKIWKDLLEGFSKYHIAKYKGKSLIDIARICHAGKSEAMSELLKTGTVVVPEEDKTWEVLRSSGMKWNQIIKTIRLPHMALLRNLRNLMEEGTLTASDWTAMLDLLKKGVKNGKQFPFRYYSAYRELEKVSGTYKREILDALEECIDLAIDNLPKLDGVTDILCDNSGSAWGSCTSEYGTMHVAEIANLSGLMTVKNSGIGSKLFVFGDRLAEIEVSKRNGILSQLAPTSTKGKAQGGGTEHGIWVYLDMIIREKRHVDNLFIYSDMQAFHGGLYGTNIPKDAIHSVGGTHVDVLKLIDIYRKKVNPKLNVFGVQVAGYNNSLLPEALYRGATLSSWTGKENLYAKQIIDTWNAIETKKQ